MLEQVGKGYDEVFNVELRKVGEGLGALGVPKAAIAALEGRIRRSHGQLAVEDGRPLTRKELQGLVDSKLRMALECIDPASLAVAGAKDVATIVGILFDKRALLRGEPTSIVGSGERREMRELLAKLGAEAARRGLVIEGEGREVRGELVAVGHGKAE